MQIKVSQWLPRLAIVAKAGMIVYSGALNGHGGCHSRRRTDESQDKLINSKRNDGRGNRAHHVWHQTAVQTGHSLFLGNK